MKGVFFNPKTHFNEVQTEPKLGAVSYVHPNAVVIGDVRIGSEVFVAPFASIRADEGTPFHIGDCSNVQDGVVLHALETNGDDFEKNTFEVEGRRYAIHIGNRVSLAHQCQVHGPCTVGDDSFIGMQAFVFKSRIGRGCVVEPGARVIGVEVGDGCFVPAGAVVNAQSGADALPKITDAYPLRNLNAGVVSVNRELAGAYAAPSEK
jgi:carbonic anhydrase/acetyltransferase-like protein (isoleucine patch superfamily)